MFQNIVLDLSIAKTDYRVDVPGMKYLYADLRSNGLVSVKFGTESDIEHSFVANQQWSIPADIIFLSWNSQPGAILYAIASDKSLSTGINNNVNVSNVPNVNISNIATVRTEPNLLITVYNNVVLNQSFTVPIVSNINNVNGIKILGGVLRVQSITGALYNTAITNELIYNSANGYSLGIVRSKVSTSELTDAQSLLIPQFYIPSNQDLYWVVTTYNPSTNINMASIILNYQIL